VGFFQSFRQTARGAGIDSMQFSMNLLQRLLGVGVLHLPWAASSLCSIQVGINPDLAPADLILGLDADPAVDGGPNTLPAAEGSLGRLN
jgi:hypothetical protein